MNNGMLLREVDRLEGQLRQLTGIVDTQVMEITTVMHENARLREALSLIAAPVRPDGTWNRDREACRLIAEEALR